nr:DUF1566 domain-containing protein [Bacteroidales bacterium]
VPASGVGTRFMWVPQKAALRAGKITDKADYWDNANIGKYSVAFNEDTKASGESSVAFNAQTVAAGSYSFAAGAGTETSASASFVVGAYNEIISGSPTAWVETDPLFVIGNGKGSRKNAVTVLKNGNIGIGFSSPSNLLEINGKIRIAGGSPVANKVLTATDANGNAIWSSISASGTDGYIQFSKAGALASNSKLFWDDAAGKVTVGGTPTDESSIVELNSTTKGFLPPRMTRIQMYNLNNPTAGLVVYNTTDKTLAFFDGSEWMSCAGKSLLHKFTVGSTTFTVFPYDGGTYTWSLAQSYCTSLNQFGYDDWYLPSRGELHYLYDNKSNIDGIGNKIYWSSTESSDMFKINAYCIDFNTGSEYTFPKTNKYNVRCIRKD